MHKTGDKVLVEGVVDFAATESVSDDGVTLVRVGFESPYQQPHGVHYVWVPVERVRPENG